MATITRTLSAAHIQKVVDALCGLYNYQSTVRGEPNPETKAQFANRMLDDWLKERVKTWERTEAIDGASYTTLTIT